MYIYMFYLANFIYSKILQAKIRKMIFDKIQMNLNNYFDVDIKTTHNYLSEIKEVRNVEGGSK